MGKQWKQWETLFFWAPKSLRMVIAAMKLKDACSLEGKTNLDSILKSRDMTLPTKVHLVKAMVFPVAMYGCESWTLKKAECRRIDAFVLWCYRRLLRVPWTARKSNQATLKEISPEHSLEGLMLKLKLQYFGHLMWRTDSFEKTLMLGKTEAGGEGDNRGWDGWIASPTPRTYLTHVHWISDAIQPPHPVIPFSSHLQSSPASGFFQWVRSSHLVAKVLELHLQHQSFQWMFRTDFL